MYGHVLTGDALLPCIKVKVKADIALPGGSPPQSYGMSLAIWDHTVLSATRHKWTRPPNPSHAGWYSIYLLRTGGRLSWPSWLDSAPAGSRTSDLSITSLMLNRCTIKTKQHIRAISPSWLQEIHELFLQYDHILTLHLGHRGQTFKWGRGSPHLVTCNKITHGDILHHSWSMFVCFITSSGSSSLKHNYAFLIDVWSFKPAYATGQHYMYMYLQDVSVHGATSVNFMFCIMLSPMLCLLSSV